MNDTTMIGAAQVEDVRAYVAAVRAWLGRPAGRRGRGAHGRDGGRPRRARGRVGRATGRPARPARGVCRRAAVRGRVASARRRHGAGCRAARAVDRPDGARGARARGPASVAARAATDLVAGPGCGGRVGAGVGARHRAGAAAAARRCRAVGVAWARCCGAGSHWARGVRPRWASPTRWPSCCSCRCWPSTRRPPTATPTRPRSSSRWLRDSRRTGHRSPTCTPMTPRGSGCATCGCSTSSGSRCTRVARRRAGADRARRAGCSSPGRRTSAPCRCSRCGSCPGPTRGPRHRRAGPRPWWWCRLPAPPSRAPRRPPRRPRARARRPLPPRVDPHPDPEPEPVTAESGARPAGAGDRLSTRRAAVTRLQ